MFLTQRCFFSLASILLTVCATGHEVGTESRPGARLDACESPNRRIRNGAPVEYIGHAQQSFGEKNSQASEKW